MSIEKPTFQEVQEVNSHSLDAALNELNESYRELNAALRVLDGALKDMNTTLMESAVSLSRIIEEVK